MSSRWQGRILFCLLLSSTSSIGIHVEATLILYCAYTLKMRRYDGPFHERALVSTCLFAAGWSVAGF